MINSYVKNICILGGLIFLSLYQVNGQTIITVPSDSSSASGTLTDESDPLDIHLEVVNTTNMGQTFTWMLKNYSTPSPNWEVRLCDNNLCYDMLFSPGPYESSMVPAGDTMDFKFQFAPHCISGTGKADVLVYITGDSANTAKMIHFTGNIIANCVNAISEIHQSNLKLYPNPVKGSFTVSGLDNAGNLSFEVYDLKGNLVKSKVQPAPGEQFEISVGTLSPGTYILKVTDENGKTVATSRLNKVN